MSERDTSADIDTAAALWAMRAEDSPLAAEDEHMLEAWLADDPRRLGAFVRAQAMLLHVARIRALGAGFDPDAYALDHADAAALPALVEPPVVEPPVVRPSRRRFLFGGSAAVAAGLIGFAGVSWQAAAATYSTRRGEIRLVPLADGSSMTLDTQTTARVRFTSGERHVELVGGEALFNVLGDPRRPFVVRCGGACVTREAASLAVSKLPGRDVTITVGQGRVSIGAAGTATRTMAANTRAVIDAEARSVRVEPIAAAEIDRQLAWRQGMLFFEDTPLSDAVAQFARYNDLAIGFGDPSISDETVTGLYSANNPEGFARSVALSLGLQASDRPGEILLRKQMK